MKLTNNLVMDNNSLYRISQKFIADLNPEVIEQIANILKLTFITKKDPQGNICLANNSEVRPEFRETFTLVDLQNYCIAILHSKISTENNQEFLNTDFNRIPIPTDSVAFWKLAQLGSELRLTYVFKNQNN
ncbi:type ISP restriction/modification enzyme [Flavobacterium sp.]|uniref:type ISP restriction/modification enzyme n=1 Tax=Flavobacterium sp. TaxID=239 RepID=UPI002CD13FF8|nr:type ISP restriction/modification enzyme [Flavobacterium sp.]HSD08701.1 type ISP restriction/modification enzyme [Flavobacterium sp.]